ncbi:MAG: P27 family phage terminase small subunit [Actinobacteria bacterium]|nr:P27 family phage terminase small subunit [Actinomycetota bacterium]
MANKRAKRPQGHRKPKLVALKPITGVVPDPPDGLRPESVATWDTFLRSEAGRVVRESDLPALRRWIQAVDEREGLYGVVIETPAVEGSRKQPVLNPLIKRLESVETRIEGFERQFGMTPRARADLGVATDHAAMTAAQLNQITRDEGKRREPERVEGFVDADDPQILDAERSVPNG